MGVKSWPCVLTVAGSDSGAGAGIQADARTVSALGGYGLTAVTSVTAQNTRRVTRLEALNAELVAAQIDAVLEDFDVRAVKTGLLPNRDVVRTVVRALSGRNQLPLVVDPVLGSTSGTRFLDAEGVSVLKNQLLPLATLVTPNWPEAEELSGLAITDASSVENAARRLLEYGGGAVLIKGGHAPGQQCRDFLLTATGEKRWFGSARIQTRNTHGTGCVLSAAIATRLAHGDALPDAVGKARRFLLKSLREGRDYKLGRGRGPALLG
jgi:hydroxymethylpyrimidine/phosphomethylpyrimidine kinase